MLYAVHVLTNINSLESGQTYAKMVKLYLDRHKDAVVREYNDEHLNAYFDGMTHREEFRTIDLQDEDFAKPRDKVRTEKRKTTDTVIEET